MAVEASVSCSRLSRTSVVGRNGIAHQPAIRITIETCVGIRLFITAAAGKGVHGPPIFAFPSGEPLKGAPYAQGAVMFRPPTKTESSPPEFVASILRGPRGADALTEIFTVTHGAELPPPRG